MPFAVRCSHCASRFALTDELYERKVKGRLVTVRCKHCKKDITVDGVELASRPSQAPPEQGTPTVPIAIETEPAAVDTTPTAPISRSASAHPPVEGLWVVSYGDDDDRELTMAQIERALLKREIRDDTLVWREGLPEWQTLASVPELATVARRAKDDKTGGLFGTGMSTPPPKPSRPPKPASPKPPAAEPKVTAADADARLPKAPPPQKREIVPDEGVVDDEAPVSSGTPDLRSLTLERRPQPEPERMDEDLLGIGGGGDLGAVLGPPTIDLSNLMSGDEPEEIEAESAPASELPRTRRDAPRARRASPEPISRPEPPASARDRRSSALPWLALAAAALVAMWWLFLRPPPPPADAPAAPAAPAPTEPVAAEPTPTSAEPPPDPAPTESAPPPAPETPTGAAPGPIAQPQPRPEPQPTPAPAPTPAPEKPKPEKEVALAPPFDKGAAVSALSAAAGRASSCRKEGDPSGTATVVVTFATSGRVTSANVTGPPFAGTPTGGCIASVMRGARVPAFSGDKVTVSKTVVIQ